MLNKLLKMLSSLLSEKERISSKMEELRTTLYGRDAVEVVMDVVNILRSTIEDAGGDRDVLAVQSEISRIKNNFMVPAHVYALLDVIDSYLKEAASTRRQGSLKDAALKALNIVEQEIMSQIREAKAMTASVTPSEGCIASIGYNSIIVDSIPNAPRADLVVIAERYPFLDGRRASRELRYKKVKTLYFPDVNIYNIIDECRMMIIPLYAFISNHIISDVGARLAVMSAREYKIPVAAVGIDLSLYTAGLDVDVNQVLSKYTINPESVFDNKQSALKWGSFSVFDRVNISHVDLIVLSSTTISKPDVALVAQTAEKVIERASRLLKGV